MGLVLIAVVGAPLVEELFFRGLLLRSIEKRLGWVWAIVGSSVFFGLAHPQDLPVEGPDHDHGRPGRLRRRPGHPGREDAAPGRGIIAHATFNLISLVVAIRAT